MQSYDFPPDGLIAKSRRIQEEIRNDPKIKEFFENTRKKALEALEGLLEERREKIFQYIFANLHAHKGIDQENTAEMLEFFAIPEEEKIKAAEEITEEHIIKVLMDIMNLVCSRKEAEICFIEEDARAGKKIDASYCFYVEEFIEWVGENVEPLVHKRMADRKTGKFLPLGFSSGIMGLYVVQATDIEQFIADKAGFSIEELRASWEQLKKEQLKNNRYR